MTVSKKEKKSEQLLSELASDQYEEMRGGRFYRSLDFLLYLLMVVLTALAIRTFLAEPVRVDGNSMYPNLLDNEHMAMEKVSLWFNPPQRGDIVICFYPGYKISCVKRVIGLPGETRKDMLETVKYVGDSGVEGIKLQLLHVLKGTDLERDYLEGRFECLSLDESVEIIRDALEVLPEDIVIHRMTGDGDKKILVAPLWSGDKKKVLNRMKETI